VRCVTSLRTALLAAFFVAGRRASGTITMPLPSRHQKDEIAALLEAADLPHEDIDVHLGDFIVAMSMGDGTRRQSVVGATCESPSTAVGKRLAATSCQAFVHDSCTAHGPPDR
jgi:hypothetical protein